MYVAAIPLASYLANLLPWWRAANAGLALWGALLAIAEEAKSDPEWVRTAPHRSRLARLDETRAARKPVLRWQPGSSA